jgi:hypothetical protein
MAAFDPATLDRWRTLAIVDRDGVTVGTIGEFYLDRETGHPTWALVNTGLFGATQTFVPLVHATEVSDGLQVPYEKNHIKDAPRVDPHDELTPDEEANLFAHYGVDYQPTPESTEGTPADPGPAAPGETDAPGAEAPGGPAVTGPPGPEASGPGSADSPGPAAPGSGRPLPPGSEASGSGGPVPPGSEAPGPVRADRDPTDGTGAVAVAPGTVDGPEPGSGAPATGPGASRAVPAEPGTVDGPEADPGSAAAAGEPRPGSGDGVPVEPGTAEPEDATLVGPGSSWSATGRGDEEPTSDPSRPVAVEPGLPGSTATSIGPTATTVERPEADAPADPVPEPPRAPDEPGWAPGAPGSFEEPEPVESPGASERWREARLTAEQERMSRSAPTQHEERSPLERARRRLERLVGGGQSPSDADDLADRETAERARRARLGLDDDDSRAR